jgi:phosphate transport system protein
VVAPSTIESRWCAAGSPLYDCSLDCSQWAGVKRSRPVSVTSGRVRFSSAGPDRSTSMTSAVRYELAALTAQLAHLCALAAEAMNHATHALLMADIQMAETVIGSEADTAAMRAAVDETTFLLLTLQPSQAADLRAVLNAIHIAADAEQMAQLAVQVAMIARNHHPRPAVPAEISGRVAELSAFAVALAGAAQQALLSREPRLFAQLLHDDAAIGDLHRQLLAVLIGPESTHGTAGVEVAVVSEMYERFADRALHIVRRTASPTNGQPSSQGQSFAELRTRLRAGLRRKVS